MFVNVIESYRTVVAIADKELVGKLFTEGVKQLDVKESFYKSENELPISEKEVKELMKRFKSEDATFNIVGENAVRCALEAGIATENSVKKIDEIPYVLILL